MKQLFSYYDEGNTRVYEGDAFITRRIDEASEKRLREIEDELDKALDLDDDKTPPMTPLNYALLACGFIIIAIMIYATSAYETVGDGLMKNPLLIGILTLACFAAVVITVIDKKKRLKNPTVTQNVDYKALSSEEDELLTKAFENLGIPSDEEGFDILTPSETEDLDTISAVDTLYLTVFAEEDAIILTDYCNRYDLKKCDFKRIEHIERPLILRDAVKPFFKNIRQEHGIKKTDDGYQIPAYDRFTLVTEHGDYTLALPVYDGKKLAEMIGLNY